MSTDQQDPRVARSVTRRTVAKGAAWTVPVLAVASTAPAVAASTPQEPGLEIVSGQQVTATRCDTIPAGQMVALATGDGTPVGAGQPVTVTLPNGLSFGDGAGSAVLSTGTGGQVQLPAILATGAAGSYSVVVTYGTASASFFVTVEAAPSTVHSIAYSGATTATTITNGKTGQVYAGNYWILDAAGGLSVWGPAFGSSNPTKLKLSGVTNFDSWSKRQDSNIDSAGALVVAGGAAYRVTANGTTPSIVAVPGIAGTIVDVKSSEYGNFLLSSAGLYYWGGKLGSAIRGPIAGTAGATSISVGKADRYTGTAGLIVLADGSTRYWKTTGSTVTLATPTNQPAGAIGTVAGGCTLSGALTTDGTLWLLDMATGTWTQKAVGVSSFNMWSINGGYAGGTFVVDGAVTQFMKGYQDVAVAGLSGIVVTQLLAADGLYYALDSTGKLYQWKGNNDRSVGAATQVRGPNFPIADVGLWGEHLSNDSYTGGGYLLGSSGC